jgi:hypothetical protein
MADDRTYLDHLLRGRAALVAEIDRLAAAVTELDELIARIDDGAQSAAQPVRARGAAAVTGGQAKPVTRRRSTARAKNGGKRSDAARGQKSIRLRVLELLEAEDRDFGLAEIIDRIRGAGIQAHDDAVRSITIKLMKDGSVERVGRGHYRLARGSDPTPQTTAAEPAAVPASYPPPLNLA